MNDLFSKPFALSIGPQACGGDILRSYFKRRTDVALPNVEETFFFDRHIHRGSDFYKSHFQDSEDIELFIEVTTTVFDHPRAPERVKEFLGNDVKLFCPLRNPVERAAEVYRHYLRYGIVKGNIREACDQAPQILFASRYSAHLENWFEHFSSIHFMSYETLRKDREDSLYDLCTFLELPYESLRQNFQFVKIVKTLFGKRPPTPPLNASDMSWLQEQLEGEKEHLGKLIKLT